MNVMLKNLTTDTGIKYQMRVEEKMCQIQEPTKFDDPYTRYAM